MEKLASKLSVSIYLLLISFLFNQEVYLNKIDIVGLITATNNQIYRNTGLYPSEIFTDNNYNGQYDVDENFIDENYNNNYDI